MFIRISALLVNIYCTGTIPIGVVFVMPIAANVEVIAIVFSRPQKSYYYKGNVFRKENALCFRLL